MDIASLLTLLLILRQPSWTFSNLWKTAWLGSIVLYLPMGRLAVEKPLQCGGPANALLEENLANDQQGLTPRVFERLFARINKEQIKHADRELKYQCRCSFLEICNEQLADI